MNDPINPNSDLATKRIFAALIDAILASVIYRILAWLLWNPLAFLAAWTLFMLRDALPFPNLRGTSPGKSIMGLVVLRDDFMPCDFSDSFKRNLPFLAGEAAFLAAWLLFGLVPFLGGVIAESLGWLTAGIIILTEVLKLYNEPAGKRIGDLYAGTQVIPKQVLND